MLCQGVVAMKINCVSNSEGLKVQSCIVSRYIAEKLGTSQMCPSEICIKLKLKI
jgi:hypothetical protein